MITGTEAEMESAVADKECGRCGQVPRIAWGGSLTGEPVHLLRCDCWIYRRLAPLLVPEVHRVERRWNDMTTKAMVRAPDTLPLTLEDIQDRLCPNADEREAIMFLRYCQAQDLNPFAHEAYLVKYSPKDPAAIIIGLAGVLRRADQHPAYAGYEGGVIVEQQDGSEAQVPGSKKPKGSKIVGGWATVYRRDRQAPLTVTVELSEYEGRKANGELTKFWRTKPGTMIEKCAISQGLRRAFPGIAQEERLGDIPVRVEAADPDPEAVMIDAPDKPIEARAEVVDEATGEIVDEPPPGAEPEPERARFANLGELMEWANSEYGWTSGRVVELARKLFPDADIKLTVDVAPFVNDERFHDALIGGPR